MKTTHLFLSTLRIGDLVRCFGVKVLIEDLGTLAAGEDARKITAKFRLAEDPVLERS